MENILKNPFAVQTPEGIEAQDVISLFVEDFADFHQILRVGHTFLHGARGSGKSMIFRYLEPDCQSLKLGKEVSQLDFFALYIPIKETELNIAELGRIEKEHGGVLFNEHLIALSVIIKAFRSLQRAPIASKKEYSEALAKFIQGPLEVYLRRGGWSGEKIAIDPSLSFGSILEMAENVLVEIYANTMQYIRRRAIRGGSQDYSGALYGYLDFVRPVLLALRELPFMPKRPIFLLIDDADNLNLEQTKILNSWVSSRGTADLSLKISTQRRYKTFRTINDQLIEAPHDFSEVNISDVYTSDRDMYFNRVRKIVEKRLSLAGIQISPEDFFPVDKNQEEKIEAIAAAIKQEVIASGNKERARHDAYRYARPEFIKSLGGNAKSRHTFSYAGFRQLVHTSSGVVRFFLEPAALMFGEQQAIADGQPITQIKPGIQDKVIKESAYAFYLSEFDKIAFEDRPENDVRDKASKLRNLIDSLGAFFHSILVSDSSERRVFSVAFSNGPDDEVRSIFDLGVEYGYFHRSSIGRKNGVGRTELYILSRRIAPVFILDPTSFAGYKFITNDAARMMIQQHRQFLAAMERQQLGDLVDSAQLSLFQETTNA